MNTSRIALILLALGLLLFAIWFASWVMKALEASGGPDADTSIWEYPAPFVVATGLAVGSIALLVCALGGGSRR